MVTRVILIAVLQLDIYAVYFVIRCVNCPYVCMHSMGASWYELMTLINTMFAEIHLIAVLMYDDITHATPMMTSSKWKHFPRYWPYVRGIHRSPVNSLQKGQ